MTDITGVPRDELLTSQAFPLPTCRAIIYRELHDRGFTLKPIGRQFHRNHASVIHGMRQLSDLLDIHDCEVSALYTRFTTTINNG